MGKFEWESQEEIDAERKAQEELERIREMTPSDSSRLEALEFTILQLLIRVEQQEEELQEYKGEEND